MLNHLLSALSEAVIAFDIDAHKFLFISPAFLRVTGFDQAAFEQNTDLLKEIIHPDDRSKIEEQLVGAIVPGEMELNYRIMTPKNQIKWMNEKRVSFVDEDSGHHIELHVLKDITDQVLYRTDTDMKVWFLLSLINAVGALIFRVNINGHYTFVNDIYTRQLGYSREELIGEPMSAFLYPSDYDILNEAIKNCLEHPGQVFHIRHRKITKDGRIRWIATDAVAVMNRQGTIKEIQGVALDITDLQKAREETLWTKNNLEALINNTEDLIWSIDAQKMFVSLNTSFSTWMEQYYSLKPETGSPALDAGFLNSEEAHKWAVLYDRALNGERFTINYESRKSSPDKIYTFEISFHPISSFDNKIIGVGCFAHEITEKLDKQVAIEKQNKKLLEIASLSSHELRRPVSSLLGLVPLLDKDNPANPDNLSIIEHIGTVADELDHVIRQIVDRTFVS